MICDIDQKTQNRGCCDDSQFVTYLQRMSQWIRMDFDLLVSLSVVFPYQHP